MTAVTGWRCWGWRFWAILRDGRLLSPYGRDHGLDVIWQPGPMRAACTTPAARERHPAPDPSCSCGFRVVEDLGTFLAEILRTSRTFLPKIVGVAELSGVVLGPDSLGDGDIDGTSRGQYATITGPLFLGRPFASAAEAVARRYGTDVIVGDADWPEWVRGPLAADWELYQDYPPALAARRYRPTSPR